MPTLRWKLRIAIIVSLPSPPYRSDGMAVPERTAVFTVRLAPSLIAGLRERAGSSGQTLSAATAEAVSAYLDHARKRHRGKAR